MTSADNPGVSGDWAGYEARRLQALAPLSVEQARAQVNMREAEAGGDEGRYLDAQTRSRILETNAATTTPDFLASSGEFEPGDLEGFARARSLESQRMSRTANGQPVASDTDAIAAYDRDVAAMTPTERQNYFRDAEVAYRNQRAGEVGEAAMRRRFPGALGEVLAAALAAGLIGGAVSGCKTCRGNRPAPPAPAAPRDRAPGEPRTNLRREGTERDPAAPAYSFDGVTGRTAPEFARNLEAAGWRPVAAQGESQLVYQRNGQYMKLGGSTLSPNREHAPAIYAARDVERAADVDRAVANMGALRGQYGSEMIPPVQRVGPTAFVQDAAPGTSIRDLSPDLRGTARRNADQLLNDARARNPGTLFDPNVDNMRFHPRTGAVRSWFDFD